MTLHSSRFNLKKTATSSRRRISHALANTHMVIIAIHNAIGVWVDPPATPDKILKALGKA